MTIPGAFVAGTALLAADMNLLPGGYKGGIATASPQTSIGTSATALTTLSVAFTAGAGRRYKISTKIPVRQRTSAGLVTLEIVKAGSTVLDTAFVSLGTDEYAQLAFWIWDVPGAGAVTYSLRMKTSANTCETAPSANAYAHLMVEDIGT